MGATIQSVYSKTDVIEMLKGQVYSSKIAGKQFKKSWALNLIMDFLFLDNLSAEVMYKEEVEPIIEKYSNIRSLANKSSGVKSAGSISSRTPKNYSRY